MPILPPQITPPYDTVDLALNEARVVVNDAMVTIGGETLTDTAPFTQTIVIAAWRRLQRFLANKGQSRLTREVVLSGVPPITNTSTDPAIQVWLNWSQYFDGANYFAPPLTPVLPQDLIAPVRLWERPTGFNARFTPMTYQLDGLPTLSKSMRNVYWEWRDDSVYMIGSLVTMDLRVRYSAYLPDFTTAGSVQWYQQQMPIMRCMSAMASYIAYEFCRARGDQGADKILAEAEQFAIELLNVDVRMKQRTNNRRRPYGRSGANF